MNRANEEEQVAVHAFALLDGRLHVIEDRESHRLMALLDVVTMFVHDYEERHVEMPDASPAEVLRFLMEQHELRRHPLSAARAHHHLPPQSVRYAF